MTTAKKTTAAKPAAKKAAPAKKLVINAKTGKMSAKAAPTVNKELEAQLAAQGPFINKAVPKAAAAQKPAKPVEKGESKADIARRLFKAMYGKKTRKEVLTAFQTEAGLTPAGSATYYANLKRDAA